MQCWPVTLVQPSCRRPIARCVSARGANRRLVGAVTYSILYYRSPPQLLQHSKGTVCAELLKFGNGNFVGAIAVVYTIKSSTSLRKEASNNLRKSAFHIIKFAAFIF